VSVFFSFSVVAFLKGGKIFVLRGVFEWIVRSFKFKMIANSVWLVSLDFERAFCYARARFETRELYTCVYVY